MALVLAAMLGNGVVAASADTPPPTIASDKADYAPGSMVTLAGGGWLPDSSVHITVNDTLGKTWQRDVDVPVGPDGSISDSFALPTTFIATYDVLATGSPSGRTAAATFTDSSADLDQCANGGVGDPPESCNNSSPGNWINGNLGGSKSHFFEGDSIPYRMKIDGLTPGSTGHTLVIAWDVTQGDKHALDYLTSYDRTVTLANPCTGAKAGDPAICDINTASTFPIPTDVSIPFSQVPGAFTIFDGTITSVSAYGVNPGSNSCPAGGPDYTDNTTDIRCITLTFTANTSHPVIAWGGHIATRLNWGFANAAVNISGSPYHMRNIALDGSGGNQDRSLSSDAVIFPATITIIKHAVPPSSTQFGFTATPAPLANFSLTDNNAGTDPSQVFTLDALSEFQPYTITEDQVASWDLTSLTCTFQDPDPGSTQNQGSFTINLPNRNVQIDLREGEGYTCTFTNELQTGTLTVIKHVINDDGGTNVAGDWSLHVKSGANEVTGSPQAGSEAGTAYTLTAGGYTVSETGAPTGYSFDGFTGDCDSSGAVTVVAGQNRTCTITNTDNAPQLKLVKDVQNNDGGTATADSWTLSATAAAPNDGRNISDRGGSGAFHDVFAGAAYTLAENPNPGTGYSSTGHWSCPGGTMSSNDTVVTVALGDSVTCTIVNTDNTPQLKLVKVVSGGSATPNNFTLYAATSVVNFTNRNFNNAGGSGTLHDVFAGKSYSLSETGPAGYTAGNWVCTDGGEQVGSTITLALGEHVTCSITNTRDVGSILAVKYHDLNGDGDSENGTDPKLPGWQLFIDSNKNGVYDSGEPQGSSDANGQVTFSGVETNVGGTTYWVCETGQVGWINSDPGNASVSANGPCKSVTVTKDTTTAVIFGNYQPQKVELNKTLNGGPLPGSVTFAFQIRKDASTDPNGVNGGNGTILATGSVTGSDSVILSGEWSAGAGFALKPGTYQLCETIVAGYAPSWVAGVYGVDWFSPGLQPGPGFQELENLVVCKTFTVQSGDGGSDGTIDLPVDNLTIGLAHTIGFWKNWTSCDGSGNQFPMLDLMISGGTGPDGRVYAGADDSNGNGLRDIRIGNLFIEGPNACKIAVDLLDKRPVGDPTKLADKPKASSDPVYSSVAQLVAYELNQLFNTGGSGSPTCQAKAASVAELMQRFLVYLNFTGGSYTMPSNKTQVTQIQANLLYLANVLDDYNNNTIIGCASALALPYPTVAGTNPPKTWQAFLPPAIDS